MLLGVGQFIYLYIISFCLKVITFLDKKNNGQATQFLGFGKGYHLFLFNKSVLFDS